MFEKILVTIDGSDHAYHALNYAVESAVKWGAELIILSVVPPIYPSIVYFGEITPITEILDNQRKYHQKILTDAVAKVKSQHPEIDVKKRFEEGRPSTVIVDIARQEDVDLIVMGSRGLGGITGWILGSTSQNVVHTCTKPILIVK